MRNQAAKNKNACPKCGGQMKLLELRSGLRLVCDYCGYEAVPARERTPEEQAAALERTRKNIQKKALASAKKRRRLILGIVLAAIAAVVLILLIVYNSALPSVDPFEYITVSFSGGNGKGEAELHIRKDKETDTSQIRYVLSQNYGLSEGDVIRVEAESEAYQLTKKRKTYTVKGLDTYLTSLASLSDEAIEAIHAKSEEVSRRNRERSDEIVHDCKYCEPNCMYLLTDEGNRNLLYDVYEAGFSMEHDEVYRVYLVTYYENIIVRDTDPVTLDYGRCFYDGKTIQFGETIFHMSTISGYETLEEIEEALTANQDPTMTLKQIDTAPEEEEETA